MNLAPCRPKSVVCLQSKAWPLYPSSRFPSSPLMIRVPFFLLFGFNKGTQKEKGKRVLLGNLVIQLHSHRHKSNNFHGRPRCFTLHIHGTRNAFDTLPSSCFFSPMNALPQHEHHPKQYSVINSSPIQACKARDLPPRLLSSPLLRTTQYLPRISFNSPP